MTNVPNDSDAAPTEQLARIARLEDQLAKLSEQVERLDQWPIGRRVIGQVERLTEQLAGMDSEVRTRRLVVVDDEGRERVVATADRGGSLKLLSIDPDDLLELSAFDGGDFAPAGPEMALRAWLGGEQIIGHVAWRYETEDGPVDRAELTHEGDEGTEALGYVERTVRPARRPSHPDERVEERRRRLVMDAEELLRTVDDLVSRFEYLQDELTEEAGDDEIAGEDLDGSGSSRVFDMLLVAQELIRQRATSSLLSEVELAERLDAEGLS